MSHLFSIKDIRLSDEVEGVIRFAKFVDTCPIDISCLLELFMIFSYIQPSSLHCWPQTEIHFFLELEICQMHLLHQTKSEAGQPQQIHGQQHPKVQKRLGSTKQPLVLVNSASCLGCKKSKICICGILTNSCFSAPAPTSVNFQSLRACPNCFQASIKVSIPLDS